MHLVHLIARLNDGGPARVIAHLARMMGERGHRVTVLAGRCADDEPDLTGRLRADGVDVETIAGLGRRIAPWSDWQAWSALRARLAALKPDVVHTHTAKAGTLGRLACRNLDLACVHTYHGHVLDGYFGAVGSAVVRWIERSVAGGHLHHALTESQRRDLCDHHHIGRPDRWRVLPIPVEPVTVVHADWHRHLALGVPVLGFLGRLAPVKDADLWLDALAVLAKNRPIQGLICGDGAERVRLETRAKTLGVPVTFTGFVPAGEALARMDVLLITSRNEGLPVAAVEAGGVLGRPSVPVVAPPVGGLRDLISAGAVLGAARSAVDLAQACAQVLDDPALRQALSERARAYAAGLLPSGLAASYEALYRAAACEALPSS